MAEALEQEAIGKDGTPGELQRGFPVEVIQPDDGVLCLFGATTLGRSELCHLRDAGLQNVTVTDEKPDRLAQVRESFPSEWRYSSLDPAEACRGAVKAGGCDIVICDGSRAAVSYIWEDLVPLALAAARRCCVLRLTGEYMQISGLSCDSGGIAQLLAQRHGLKVDIVGPLRKRSSANGGTYWIVLDASGPLPESPAATRTPEPIDFNSIGYGREHCVQLSDLLGIGACTSVNGHCQDYVDRFRTMIGRKERAPVFRAFTSPRFAALPPARIDTLAETAAAFDLERFKSIDEVWEAARLVTSKRGTVNRKVNRAVRLGYYARPFNSANFVPDIYAVNTSMETRAGKPMRENYRRSIESMGGYPKTWQDVPEPPCPVHSSTFWGVFREVPGRRQGDVVVNEELCGYINLVRYGNHAWYSTILGHGDHLEFAVMYLLHFAVVEHMLSNATGLRYLMYSGMNSRGQGGPLYKWKRRCLFEPKYPIYDEAGDWRMQAVAHPTGDGEEDG